MPVMRTRGARRLTHQIEAQRKRCGNFTHSVRLIKSTAFTQTAVPLTLILRCLFLIARRSTAVRAFGAEPVGWEFNLCAPPEAHAPLLFDVCCRSRER